MIGMRLAPFSKDSDDHSITISMKENYQKSGGNLKKKIMSMYSKTEDGTSEYES